MGQVGGHEHDQAAAYWRDIPLAAVRQVDAQFTAVLRRPFLVEVDDGRDGAAVIVTEAVEVLAIEGACRVTGKVAFEILQPQVEVAIQRFAQAVHQCQVVVAGLGLPGFDPEDMVATYAFAHFLALATPHGRRGQLALFSALPAFGRQGPGQRLGQEDCLVRPALIGEVVDNTGNLRMFGGYVHGAHGNGPAAKPTAPLGRIDALASRQSPARPRTIAACRQES